MTHTSGPWSCDYGDLSVYCETGAEVCEVTPGNNDDGTAISVAEMQDNARLIAAAPELLEALKLLLFQGGENYACYCNDPDYQFNSGRDKCDNCIAASAIAKAEGRDE